MVSPARAGIDPYNLRVSLVSESFPRPCGDRPYRSLSYYGGKRFPPPVRG